MTELGGVCGRGTDAAGPYVIVPGALFWLSGPVPLLDPVGIRWRGISIRTLSSGRRSKQEDEESGNGKTRALHSLWANMRRQESRCEREMSRIQLRHRQLTVYTTSEGLLYAQERLSYDKKAQRGDFVWDCRPHYVTPGHPK